MHELYSSGLHDHRKVVTVFVGGTDIPSRKECCVALTMDPEITAPVLVIPFGGLPFDGVEDDDSVAMIMISQNTPDFIGAGFCHRCTRIRDVLLIKVMTERTGGSRARSKPATRGATQPIP